MRLTAHDWHGPQPIAFQDGINKDPVTNGFWAVDVKRAGAYQFLLSRRPLDAPAPLQAVSARVEVGGMVAVRKTHPTAVLAPVTVRLQPGITKLKTELIHEDGSSRGAYFVTVQYLGDVSDAAIHTAQDKLPGCCRREIALPGWVAR